MNNIDFTKPGGFPLDTNALDFLQSAFASSINALAALGGSDNYILSGCVVNGSNVSTGWVVINGELLPFAGGIAQTKVLIRENKESVRFQDLIERDVIVTRRVEFGTGTGEILFSSLLPIKNLLTVKTELASIQQALDSFVSVPSGVIVAWSGAITAIPAGWALCNGSAVGIPDLRDRFILGAGGTRIPGAVGGSENVTLDIDHMPSHNHTFRLAENGAGSDALYPAVTDNHTVDKGTASTENVGLGEPFSIMPSFYALAYIIKL